MPAPAKAREMAETSDLFLKGSTSLIGSILS
jgi:hypothetical protein